MSWIRRDLRLAVRAFRQGRLVAVFAVVSLALAVAGNAVTFSLINTWIIKPLPYPEPERLVIVGEREKDDPELIMFSLFSSLPTWAEYRERTRTLEGWSALLARSAALSEGDRSVAVTTGHVSPSFFRTLGAKPVRGRFFQDHEGFPGGPRVAVVAWEHWQNNMGPERDPLGSVLRLDGEAWEVVGVVEEGFEFIVPGIGIWLPLQDDLSTWGRDQRYAIAVARLAPGVTMEQVEDEVAAVAGRIEDEFPETHRGWTANAINLRTEFPEPQTKVYLALVQGAMLFVLLIACANIMNLLLVRNQDRQREIALRSALGAGRGRILGQLVRESLILSLLGGALGLGLAWLGIRITGARAEEMMMQAAIPTLDLNVVGFGIGVIGLCALMFGLVPGLQSLRRDHVGALKDGGAGGAGAGRGGRLVRGLVVAEVALCVVALGGGSVFVRSFAEMRGRHPGYESERLMTVRFEVPGWKYTTDDEVLSLLDRIRSDVAAAPGVERAALVSTLPEHILASTDTFRVAGEPVEHGRAVPRAISVRASPEYIETMGIPLLQGRFFEASDRAGAPPVVVVSEIVAQRRFPGRSAVGRRLTFRGESREIVGVVGNVDQTLLGKASGEPEETVYRPVAQATSTETYLVARTTGEPRAAAAPIEARLLAADPDIVLIQSQTMKEFAGRFLGTFDVLNWILGGFGAFALLLASLGTYGVVAYAVSRRRHEIGVRSALGAAPSRVVGMFAREGMLMSLIGLALGALVLLPVVAVAQRVVEVQGLAPVELEFLLGVAALLFAVTVAASVFPALRAARVDPARVLKVE